MVDPHFQNHLHELGFILNSIKGSSYLGIFFFSMFISYLIPLPEVVLLLLIGFLAKTADFSLPVVIIVSFIGTLFGDNVLYRLSFFGNKFVERFNHKMRAHKLIKYEHLVVDNVGKTIFFLRFITGVRFSGPVIAGTLGVSWRKFFFYNAIATFVHGVLFILIGFYTHRKIVWLITEVEIIRNILFFSSVFIVALLVSFFGKDDKFKNAKSIS